MVRRTGDVLFRHEECLDGYDTLPQLLERNTLFWIRMEDLTEERLALVRDGCGAAEEVSDVEVCCERWVGADGMRPREMATAHVDEDDAYSLVSYRSICMC